MRSGVRSTAVLLPPMTSLLWQVRLRGDLTQGTKTDGHLRRLNGARAGNIGITSGHIGQNTHSYDVVRKFGGISGRGTIAGQAHEQSSASVSTVHDPQAIATRFF